ncbi:hypothetical protein ACP275_11G103000 [Erythranthe tilingii]
MCCGRKRPYHTLLRLRQISMAEARVERLRARLAELTRRLEENRKKIKFGDVMQILETYLRRRYNEQQDDLLWLGSAPSSVLELLVSVAAVNGSDDFWDLIVEYERDDYIDAESDDDDNNIETNHIS